MYGRAPNIFFSASAQLPLTVRWRHILSQANLPLPAERIAEDFHDDITNL
jgi:hypothetical protein